MCVSEVVGREDDGFNEGCDGENVGPGNLKQRKGIK